MKRAQKFRDRINFVIVLAERSSEKEMLSLLLIPQNIITQLFALDNIQFDQ